MDETRISNKILLHLFLGKLREPSYAKLVSGQVLKETNALTVSRAVDNCIEEIDFDRKNFISLLSDAATYMNACTRALECFTRIYTT